MDLDINLLVKKNNYYRIERIFLEARRITIILGVLSAFLLGLLFILQNRKSNEMKVVAADKTALENEMRGYVKTEEKIKLFNYRVLAMHRIMDSAPDFENYYNRLEKYMPTASSEGILKKISLSEPRAVVADLEFPDILSLTKFLGTMESKEFLDEFESVRISSIVFASTPDILKLSVNLVFKGETQSK